MKLSKLFVLVMSTAMLVACGGNTKESKETVNNSADAVTSAEAPVSTEAGVSVEATSSSSSTTTTTSSSSSSTGTQTAGTYAISFYNTMEGANNSTVAGKLKTYINEHSEANFVASAETDANGTVQIQEYDCTTRGKFRMLQLGSGSKTGTLTFTFSKTVKSIKIKCENFNRNWVNGQTGEPGSTEDTLSKLYVNADSNEIDLTATKGNPNKKEVTVDVNSTTLKLYTKTAGNARVFVEAITFNI